MPAFEVIALDTATPQLRAPGAGDTYLLPRSAELAAGTAFGWAGATLWSSGANVIQQYNGGNAQRFEIFNTRTDASNFERAFLRWSANVFQIGTEASGTGTARNLRFMSQVQAISGSAGTPGYAFSASENTGFYWDGAYINFAVSGSRVAYIRASDASFPNMTINARSKLLSNTDSNVTLTNNSENAFNLLQLGGTSASYPAIKRSSTAIHIRLANDADFAELVFKLPTTNPGPGTLWNNAGVLSIGT